MNAMLVIKTANGYVVMPCTQEYPQIDPAQMHVATELGDRYSSSLGPTVMEILRDHFATETALKEAA